MSDAMRSRQWRSHYAHTIDRLDKTGVIKRLAAVEDFQVAEATWRAAIKRSTPGLGRGEEIQQTCDDNHSAVVTPQA